MGLRFSRRLYTEKNEKSTAISMFLLKVLTFFLQFVNYFTTILQFLRLFPDFLVFRRKFC